jgi:carboxypeptidase Taq
MRGMSALENLHQSLAELVDLRHAGQVLGWDQQTMMPARGGGARAEALGTLERISHERFVADETGRRLEAAAAECNGADPDSDDARLISVVRRRWEKARRIPVELAAEMARAASLGHEAWVAARAASDFEAFAPYLERNVELARRYVECLPEFDTAYDALLDDYEPGMRTAEVSRIFGELKDGLVPLIARVRDAGEVDVECLHRAFGVERQRRLVDTVLARMGFDPAGWRLDEAAHPFATSFGPGDVRLTTRWDERYFPGALYGAMHECGHGLYEAGIDAGLQRTPLGHAESLGLHESQSRMWENMVGRSRAFCTVLAPLVSQHSGQPVDADTLFRAVNRVAPSFIRVEADEATYGLHIVLRFEIEQELIDGRLSVAELPEAWNARFAEYLGLEVTDPADGVLQDVHWAGGAIGYFPTYALGNLIAAQLWQRIATDLPDLEERLAAGELTGLREWLREHVHRHGAKFAMPELLERVVGGPLEVTPFLTYLKAKLGDVYGLDLSGTQ